MIQRGYKPNIECVNCSILHKNMCIFIFENIIKNGDLDDIDKIFTFNICLADIIEMVKIIIFLKTPVSIKFLHGFMKKYGSDYPVKYCNFQLSNDSKRTNQIIMDLFNIVKDKSTVETLNLACKYYHNDLVTQILDLGIIPTEETMENALVHKFDIIILEKLHNYKIPITNRCVSNCLKQFKSKSDLSYFFTICANCGWKLDTNILQKYDIKFPYVTDYI